MVKSRSVSVRALNKLSLSDLSRQSMDSKKSRVILDSVFALSAFCFTFLVAFIAGYTFFSVNESKADEPPTAEGNTISMSTNAVNDEIILPIVPTPTGALVSDELVVTVSTDNITGYTLKMHSLTNNTDLVNVLDPNQPNTSTIPTSPLVPTLPVITSTSAPTSNPAILSPNTWGYTLDTPLSVPPTFSAIPTFSTPDIIKYTEEPGTNSATTITFAANANNALPAGTYTGTIVFTATANPVPTICGTFDYECIVFTINTTDGTYSIPTSGLVGNLNNTYNWDVYVDNVPTTACTNGNCTGTGSTSGSGANGIALTGLSSGQHQIKILPHNSPTPGWGNAFGHYSNTTGANAQANKNKLISLDSPLTTMAFAPKTNPTPTMGALYMFGYIFYGCTNLTTTAILMDTYKLPGTITNLTSFLHSIHYGNTNLTTPIDLTPLAGWLNANTSITGMGSFLNSSHRGNTSLTTPIDLAPVSGWFNANTSITALSSFLGSIHYGNNLTAPIDLTPVSGWFNANNAITALSSFLSSTHHSNNLTTTIDLTPVSGWFNANTSITDLSYFLSSTYYGNNLTTPIDLAPVSGWFNANTSITALSSFLHSIHYGNTNLTTPIDLTPVSGWFNANTSIANLSIFLSYTHNNNNLTTPIDFTPLTNWFNANTSITNLASFLCYTHGNNTNLTTPIDLTPVANWFTANTSITNLSDFLSFSHYHGTNLNTPIDLTPVAGWFNANTSITNLSSFLSYTHNSNTNLTTPIDLTPVANWFNANTSITNLSDFLSFTYYQDTNLSTPINLTPIANWFSGGRSFTGLTDFMNQAHRYNPNLTLSGQTIFPNWIKTATEGTTPIWNVTSAFRLTFSTASSKSGDTGEPRFQDGTVLSSLSASAGTPDTNRSTYNNRSGITPVNPNWK